MRSDRMEEYGTLGSTIGTLVIAEPQIYSLGPDQVNLRQEFNIQYMCTFGNIH